MLNKRLWCSFVVVMLSYSFAVYGVADEGEKLFLFSMGLEAGLQNAELFNQTVADTRYLRIDGSNSPTADISWDGNTLQHIGGINFSETIHGDILLNGGLSGDYDGNQIVFRRNASDTYPPDTLGNMYYTYSYPETQMQGLFLNSSGAVHIYSLLGIYMHGGFGMMDNEKISFGKGNFGIPDVSMLYNASNKSLQFYKSIVGQLQGGYRFDSEKLYSQGEPVCLRNGTDCPPHTEMNWSNISRYYLRNDSNARHASLLIGQASGSSKKTLDVAGNANITGMLNVTGTSMFRNYVTIRPPGTGKIFSVGDNLLYADSDMDIIYTTGQIVSTKATGRPPFDVASTTKVINLNVDKVDDYTTAGLSGSAPISVSSGSYALNNAGTGITISHSTSAGYKHIPTGGSSNQLLKNSGTSGTASWGTVTESSGALASITTLSMSSILTMTSANPKIEMTDSTTGEDDYTLTVDTNGFNITDTTDRRTVFRATGDGTVYVQKLNTSGTLNGSRMYIAGQQLNASWSYPNAKTYFDTRYNRNGSSVRHPNVNVTNDLFGSRQSFGYSRTTLSADGGMGAGAMSFGTTSGYLMPSAGSIRAFTAVAYDSAHTTTGKVYFQVLIGNSSAAVHRANLTLTPAAAATIYRNYTNLTRNTIRFNAGDFITMNADFSGFAGTIAPIVTTVEVQYDR